MAMIELTREQQEAVEQIDQNMLITAGAGSGKTLVLVRRFVEILEKQPHLSVGNLLAVTYTRRAAREMRTRIKARLKELYAQAKDGDGASPDVPCPKQNWQRCLAEMDTAHIDTIHSLCQSILRSFAIHAGVDTRIDLLEDVEQAQLIEEAVEETLRQAIASCEDDYLIITNFSPNDISDMLHEVLAKHLQFRLIADRLRNLTADDLKKEFDQLLAGMQKQFLVDLSLDQQWQAAADYVTNNPHFDVGSELEKIRRAAVSLVQGLAQDKNDNSVEQSAAGSRAEWSVATPVRASGGTERNQSAASGCEEQSQATRGHERLDERSEGQAAVMKDKQASNWALLLELSLMDKPGNRGGRSESAVELRKQINVLIDKARVLASKLPADNQGADEQYWQLWRALLFIADRALNIYRVKKQHLQKLDYDDLIAKASQILHHEDSHVRRHYNQVFSHILVDEFQDTNDVQSNIIKMLAGPNTKLFFIGDDKQSIYKFQGADLGTFNALRKEMNDNRAFDHSFRSTPAIVNFVNSIFTRLLHADFAHVDYRAKYRALTAKRHSNLLGEKDSIHEGSLGHTSKHELSYEVGYPDNHEPSNVEIIQLPVADADSKQPNALPPEVIEGRAVADWIKTKVEKAAPILGKDGKVRAINYGDFAILVRRNSDFQFLEPSLSQYGIPYVTSGGKTFLQRQEIYDLENMLLFLSNPSDSHALLGILRSPMFAISDDLIHQLATAGAGVSPPTSERNNTDECRAKVFTPTSLWHSLQTRAERKQPGFELVNDAVMTLKRLLADLPSFTLSQLIYKVIRETNYDLTVLHLPDGKQRYKNIWKLHTLAGQKEDLSVSEFAQYLNSCRQLSVDVNNAPVDSGNAVKLMTIHAAKGLEFPAVALPRLSAKGRPQESKLLFHQQFGIVINTMRGGSLTKQERDENMPPAYRMSQALHKDMDIAEQKRLLYVAMTRARDYLGIFIKERDKKGEDAANWLRTLLCVSGDTGDKRITSSPVSHDRFPITDKVNDRPLLSQHDQVSSNQLVDENLLVSERLLVNRPDRSSADQLVNKNLPANEPLLVNEHLLEPISVHLGVSPLPVTVEFIPRITPSPSNLSSVRSILSSPLSVPTSTQSVLSRASIEADHSLVGTFFHKIMQYLPQGKTTLGEDELYALVGQMAEAAAHPQIAQALIDQARKLLAIYAGSELQLLISKAKTICHEWSYYTADSSELKSLIPDLLLETSDGNWYLIDYKTDHFPLLAIEQQALRHRPQLERYRKDLLAFTGIAPQIAIYFAQHGILQKLV